MATKAKKNITTGETVIRIEGMHKLSLIHI